MSVTVVSRRIYLMCIYAHITVTIKFSEYQLNFIIRLIKYQRDIVMESMPQSQTDRPSIFVFFFLPFLLPSRVLTRAHYENVWFTDGYWPDRRIKCTRTVLCTREKGYCTCKRLHGFLRSKNDCIEPYVDKTPPHCRHIMQSIKKKH